MRRPCASSTSETPSQYAVPMEPRRSISCASSKARTRLGWKPRTSFGQLVDMMVEGDLELARREAVLKGLPAAGRKAA